MFGYVRVDNPELRVKEYEFYRGAYCGLCRSMGKCTGQCSRMTLNYDFVFLALVRMVLTDEKAEFKQKRCLAHPLKKRNSMLRNAQLEFSSKAAALLTYHKLKDDISDEKGFKKLRACLLLPFASHARKKALKQGLSELDGQISEGLLKLSETEKSLSASVDTPAKVFGEILGSIMESGLEGHQKRVAYALGEHIGRWIYIADALDDAPDDMEKKRYNPFVLLYGGRLPTAEELDNISLALKNELFSVESAVDLIEPNRDCNQNTVIMNIIRNIIYLGMPQKIKQIIDGEKNRCDEEKGGNSKK